MDKVPEEHREDYTIREIRIRLGLTQDIMGLLMGCKKSLSRIECGYRKETLIHQESLCHLVYLSEIGLLRNFINWRVKL